MPTHKTRLAQVPDEWSSRVTWLQYWRALTQYLLSPGPRLAAGLARTLQARRPVRCGQLCSAASRCAQSTLQQVLQPYTPHAPR